ncbi:MAG TPA: TIGR03668 family PPOX class F420-dependent oxidoreductase [Stellaceae bacterium]|nr:TIGR03668 family PPOX class F420-dependent oxidoreductase [Stellaceae bacterium]
MVSTDERRFVNAQRVGRLATADARAIPHVVPICFALSENTLYSSIDDKPKQDSRRPLKRLRNIAANPNASVVIDRYDEDWTLLGWVLLRGRTEILTEGTEHDHAQALLRARYPQYQTMQITSHPVIALRIERAASWGNLSAH